MAVEIRHFEFYERWATAFKAANELLSSTVGKTHVEPAQLISFRNALAAIEPLPKMHPTIQGFTKRSDVFKIQVPRVDLVSNVDKLWDAFVKQEFDAVSNAIYHEGHSKHSVFRCALGQVKPDKTVLGACVWSEFYKSYITKENARCASSTHTPYHMLRRPIEDVTSLVEPLVGKVGKAVPEKMKEMYRKLAESMPSMDPVKRMFVCDNSERILRENVAATVLSLLIDQIHKTSHERSKASSFCILMSFLWLNVATIMFGSAQTIVTFIGGAVAHAKEWGVIDHFGKSWVLIGILPAFILGEKYDLAQKVANHYGVTVAHMAKHSTKVIDLLRRFLNNRDKETLFKRVVNVFNPAHHVRNIFSFDFYVLDAVRAALFVPTVQLPGLTRISSTNLYTLRKESLKNDHVKRLLDRVKKTSPASFGRVRNAFTSELQKAWYKSFKTHKAVEAPWPGSDVRLEPISAPPG